jgi:hypothetical protein
MSVLRRHLAWVVCAWLAGQAAGIAAAPFALCCSAPSSAHDDEKCCPGLLPGQVCPMHHTREGAKTCKMRSACGPSGAALIALSSGLGDLPSTSAFASTLLPADIVGGITRPAIARAHLPESPPPRS